jgi:hypothetical protein
MRVPVDDLSSFCSLNPAALRPGTRGCGNLTVTAGYASNTIRRLLRWRTSKARPSERNGTPPVDSRLPPEMASALPTRVTAVARHVHAGLRIMCVKNNATSAAPAPEARRGRAVS